MRREGIADVSLRHFRAFLAVAESGQLTAASALVRRSPSSVSRSVAILEDTFGAALLTRGQGGFATTPAGSLVAARCRIVKAEFDACRDLLVRAHRVAVRQNAAVLALQCDVAHLRAVIAVHDFRSVQRAAQVLSVSQPAISYSLRLLEADLGLELFSRMPTGMIPTPAGISFTVCARRVLSELSKMVDDVRSEAGEPSGLVCVGALAYSRTAILPEAINQTLARHAGIVVRTVEGPIDALLTSLHCDDIDVVICAYPDRTLLDGIDVQPIATDPMGLFVSREHPLAGAADVPLDALAAYPFILPPAGSITRQLLEDFFRDQAAPAPRGRAETSSYSVVRNLLLESHHIAFRSLREFATGAPDDPIVALDMAPALPSREICLLQRRGIWMTAAVRDFLDIVRNVAAPATVGGK